MMFLILSKILPLLIYPLGLASIVLIVALLLRRTPQRSTRLTLLALAILWIGGNRWVANMLVRSLEWQYLPPETIPQADVIVLLGGGAEPALWPRQLPELSAAGDRIFYAAHLYHEGHADAILISGGRAVVNTPDAPTEAATTAVLLEMLGVPAEAIWEEDASRNTYENGLYSQEILVKEGIHTILLVTSATHMPRSVGIFEKLGVEVIPAPADFNITQADWEFEFRGGPEIILFNFLPQPAALNLTSIALKEYVGIAVYWLRGWL